MKHTLRQAPEWVLMTRELIGEGTEKEPCREALRFWDSNSLMNLCTYDPLDAVE